MSRRGISRRPRVLIDTAFLLPVLGIEVEEEVLKAIKLFRRPEVYYLEIGVLEAVRKILKVVPPGHLGIVRVGLDSIRNTYDRLDIPVEAYEEAYRIYSKGHRDYIDALYYSTTKATGIPWQHSYRVEGVVHTLENLEKTLEDQL